LNRDGVTAGFIRLAGRTGGWHDPEVVTPDGWRTVGALIMAQAVHHADDHRTHVLSVIGACGLDLPGLDIGEDLDVWHYGIATDLMQQVTPEHTA
jgi:hypothetical protein